MSESAVKSAQRVLEILQLFATTRQPMAVGEVAEQLGFPQSSTSVLLKSLDGLGYLKYDTGARRYFVTLRVMLLGAWMQDAIFGEGSLVAVMDLLRRQTGQTVMLGLRQDLHVRYILTLRGSNTGSVGPATGSTISVCRSAMGKVLLAEEKDADIGRLVQRVNADDTPPIYLPALLRELRECRRTGWAVSRDFPRAGRAALAVAMPFIEGQPSMAVGLGATNARIDNQREVLLERMREACQSLHAKATSGLAW